MATSTPSRARQGTWRCAARKFILGGSLAPGARRFNEWSATSWSAWGDDDDDDDDDDGCTDVNYHTWYCQDNEVWHGGACSSSCNSCTARYKASDIDSLRHYILASDGGYGCNGYCFICSGNTLQHGHYEDGEWKERYEAPASLHCNPNCGDYDDDDDLWKPTTNQIDLWSGDDEDDDTDAWADKYLVEENWDDDDEDAWLSVHIKPNTPSAIVTSHTWTQFPLDSGIGKTGIIAQAEYDTKALNVCYIFTATGKNNAKADILSKIVWKVDPVCTGLSCPKITGEFVGLDHEICIDKSGRIEKVTGPTSVIDGAAPKATAAATLLAIAAAAVVF
ncbi:unnamed protein product [Pelagomonas calceolata]|uniref:Uncharacterized protein n=2 Tax=Pelagomonas calceolata TaxID=35677 RepID=A0A8J2X1U1_9STRA|nr:unnamed protein product [Pelagomonas calceolata]